MKVAILYKLLLRRAFDHLSRLLRFRFTFPSAVRRYFYVFKRVAGVFPPAVMSTILWLALLGKNNFERLSLLLMFREGRLTSSHDTNVLL